MAQHLLSAVRAAVTRLGLEGSVDLRGRRPHAEMPLFYGAADLFVLGSHQEGSGFALLEALACGLPPVVTDIPPFRRITDDGRIGVLWPRGAPEACARAIAAASRQPFEPATIRRYFETSWSFPAIARAAAEIYRAAHARACAVPGLAA